MPCSLDRLAMEGVLPNPPHAVSGGVQWLGGGASGDPCGKVIILQRGRGKHVISFMMLQMFNT